MVLKGHGFSRAAERRQKISALAAEGMHFAMNIPSGVKTPRLSCIFRYD
jgi:hypothetical protein